MKTITTATALRLGALCLAIVLMPSAAVRAQSNPPSALDAAREGLRREEDRAARALQQLQTLPPQLRPETHAGSPEQLPEETPCFTIKKIELVGPEHRRFAWLADSAAPFIGQCAGVAGLRQIASALDTTLIELGYVTSRVGMPQQNLADGTLTFSLHIGRVADILLVQDDAQRQPDERWGTWRNAFPLSSGDILNIRDLEQGVEQMKRLPSQSVATLVEPGSGGDTSNVLLLRQVGDIGQRTRAGITLDNSGSELLGRLQLASFLSFDNPLGLNDLITVSANTNARNPRADNRSQSLSFQYSIPWGYYTFSLSQSVSRFAQRVQGTTVDFLSSGRSRQAEFRVDRTLIRTSASSFGAYAALSTRRAWSYLDDVELIVQRARTTSFEVGIGWRHLAAPAIVDLQLGFRRGMPWQNAQDDFSGTAFGGLTNRPTVSHLTGSIVLPFKLADRTIRYSGSARAQHTPDVTLSVDQIAIGNRYSVRGFDGDRVLLAENGYFVRNEFSTPVSLHEQLNATAYIGIDFGRVWGPSDFLLLGNRLAGAAIGLRGQFSNLQFDLTLATPMARPTGFKTRRWNSYLSATVAF